MSNRAILLNTEILSCDRRELEKARRTLGASYVEIGQAANRIPVPWLCCFRTADLHPVEVEHKTGPSSFDVLRLSLPCTTVSAARERLSDSLPLYIAIVGNTVIAEDYWRYAMEGLADLPFQYLTIDPVEVLFLNDPNEEATALANCLRGTSDTIALIKRLAFIDGDYPPYTFQEFFNGPAEALDDDARNNNSAALDPGYSAPEYRTVYGPEASALPPAPAEMRRKPWWKLW
ncbi:MAG: hypothetical protein LM517_03195 [Nitrosomonas sp.]|nr:hypothetical protein [Nitrosomonas sp.]